MRGAGSTPPSGRRGSVDSDMSCARIHARRRASEPNLTRDSELTGPRPAAVSGGTRLRAGVRGVQHEKRRSETREPDRAEPEHAHRRLPRVGGAQAFLTLRRLVELERT